MEKIEGISLQATFEEIKVENLAEQKAKVKEQLRGYFIGQKDCYRSIIRLQRELKDQEEKIAKINQKIKLIQEENWSPLQESKPEQKKQDPPSQE
jgi:bacterioferritin (cytochrome b1)